MEEGHYERSEGWSKAKWEAEWMEDLTKEVARRVREDATKKHVVGHSCRRRRTLVPTFPPQLWRITLESLWTAFILDVAAYMY